MGIAYGWIERVDQIDGIFDSTTVDGKLDVLTDLKRVDVARRLDVGFTGELISGLLVAFCH